MLTFLRKYRARKALREISEDYAQLARDVSFLRHANDYFRQAASRKGQTFNKKAHDLDFILRPLG